MNEEKKFIFRSEVPFKDSLKLGRELIGQYVLVTGISCAFGESPTITVVSFDDQSNRAMDLARMTSQYQIGVAQAKGVK